MSTANLTLLRQESIEILQHTAPAFASLGLVIGLLGIMANLIIIVVVCKERHKLLESNHFFCLLMLSISDAVLAVTLTCVAVKRLVVFLSGTYEAIEY